MAGSPQKTTPRNKTARKKSSDESLSDDLSEAGQMRLQRVLAAAGYGSRRRCEELIVDGRVEIDGQTVTQLGTKVDPRTSRVRVDGVALKQPKRVYFALNKPTGVVTTDRDPQGRPRVVDMINEPQRVFPVGRLDRNSEGLILLTNDGELAQQLAHPSHGVAKTYMVTVAGLVEPETLREMRQGVYFPEGRFQVDQVRKRRTRGKATELEIVLREGKNREIRRILARLGHKVVQLKRTAIGTVRLGQLPTGAYRALDSREVKALRAMLHQGGSPVADERTAKSGSKKTRVERSGRAGKPKSQTTSHATSQANSRGRVKAKGKAPTSTRRSTGDIIIRDPTESAAIGTVIGAPVSEKPAKSKKPARRGAASSSSSSSSARRRTAASRRSR